MGIILFKLAKPAFQPQILKPHDLSTNHKNLPTKNHKKRVAKPQKLSRFPTQTEVSQEKNPRLTFH